MTQIVSAGIATVKTARKKGRALFINKSKPFQFTPISKSQEPCYSCRNSTENTSSTSMTRKSILDVLISQNALTKVGRPSIWTLQKDCSAVTSLLIWLLPSTLTSFGCIHSTITLTGVLFQLSLPPYFRLRHLLIQRITRAWLWSLQRCPGASM